MNDEKGKMMKKAKGRGVGVARFSRENRRSRVKKEDGASDLTKRLVTVHNPTSIASEAYRKLRTNLLYSAVDCPRKVLIITSPGQSEGKSTTCANLGVVLAQAGKSTLIVDCDLRKPVMHKFFGLRNFHGIVDVLVGEVSLQEVCEEVQDCLKLIPAGTIPLNPTEIIGGTRFSRFVASTREEFDYVLIDAAPIEPVADSIILATQGDGVLLVLDAENTGKRALRESIRELDAVEVNILGTVMNNVNLIKGGYMYYEYGQ